ncbi:MAG: MG2 domain-containing protein [Blastocatellia bacterium]
MHRRWIFSLTLGCLVLLAVLSATLISSVTSAAGVSLRVNETATRVRWREGKTEVALAVENLTARDLPVRISLEWLDPRDFVRSRAERREMLRPGAGQPVIPLSLPFELNDHHPETLWYRVRYRLTPDSSAAQSAPLEGLISLSTIAPDIFELRVIASEYPLAGKTYRAHARALHPVTSRPVRDVQVTAELKFDNERKTSFKTSGLTDAQGYATLEFNLPRELDAHDGELAITAVRGDFAQQVSADLRDDHLKLTQMLLTTDKPLYQPGQTLHLRVLALDFTKRAIAQAGLSLEIEDPEGTTQFRAEMQTSRFGIASADWQIPANTRLGDYRIRVELDDDKYGSNGTMTQVKISRYDLPNFAVQVKADRAYYLPGQNAEITVSADYLFGQPVKRGQVRLVRETEREWNYREQKWDISEAEKYEGETDEAGRFIARIDLADTHDKLKGEDYRRFLDLNYAAYFTDLTTGRTEQRRLDLRLTREAIHIYVIGADDAQAEGLPLQFYVSTSYADGTPASCEVTISEQVSNRAAGADSNEFTSEPVQKISTSRYGVAKVSGLRLREREDRGSELRLAFTARDRQGVTGQHTDNIWLRDHGAIRIETNRTLYRAGEPIEVQLVSNQPDVTAVLSVSQQMQTLHSQVVRLRRGRAFVVIPYRREFSDEILISAHADSEAGDEYRDYYSFSRSVLYPRDRELRLNVKLDRAEYRPGEEARASFRVTSADGRPLAGALGVTVIDRAIEERARTDQEFSGRGSRYDFIGAYLSEYEGLAGVTRRALNKLNLAQPLPEGLELVAEILLRDHGISPRVFTSDRYSRDQRQVFSRLIEPQLRPVQTALNVRYQKTGEYPRDQAALRQMLNETGIRPDELRDPWGVPYRASFVTVRENDVFNLTSSGADKQFNTADDFTVLSVNRPYFKPQGEIISRVARQYYNRTGAITLDAAVLKTELRENGFDFEALRDQWGRAYEISLSAGGTFWYIVVRSSGENRKFETERPWSADDFSVWSASIDYFADSRARIDAALSRHSGATGNFPEKDDELRAVMKANDIAFDQLRDPWGGSYYTVFSTAFRYSDRVVIRYSEEAKQKNEINPVTQRISVITLRSRGADGKEGTPDDFTIAEFVRLTAEQTSFNAQPQTVSGSPVLSGAGAISGVITDVSGAIVAGVTVKATNKITLQTFQAVTDSEGRYLIRVPGGRYDVRCDAAGFKSVIVSDVPVQSSSVVEVRITLDVGSVSEMVAVTGGSARYLQTDASAVSEKKVAGLPQTGRVSVVTKSEISTPRLREHFQETLVWHPSLETDRQGRAHLKFKLADNITTWKLKVIGSTVDGEIGTAEREFLAFQPFFAEHDPPRVLTVGDEIALPVVLRNYLDKTQTVEAEIKPEAWFTLPGPARKRAIVKAGDAANVIFDFRAATAIKDGKQRITAIGGEASDAIEKPVSVHPDGEEMTQTASDVFTTAGCVNVSVPADAIKGSAQAELKIYPNLMAHALEGIEGILQRPYGCGEQTISSTYPNVMALRYLEGKDERMPAVAAKARRYARAGYERLLGYRTASGGFSYWGRGEADLALTAYALRFLNDAKEFVEADEDVINQARAWLISQQQNDGRWIAHSWSNTEDTRRTAMTTAFIARVLAQQSRAAQPDKAVTESLRRALDYLAQRIDEIDEPYLIASFALAAMDANDTERGAKAISRLRALAREEAGTSYWSLESNTPFYGWGLAGRIETTALAVKALKRDAAKNNELVNRGLLFLLRHKDRYGVWLSTQATINVLETLIELNDTEAGNDQGGQADVFINGQRISAVTLPPGHQLSNPLTVDLSPFLSQGDNRIEIRRAGNAVRASAQLVATHYAAWKPSETGQTENFRPGDASALRLAVSYDKAEAKPGDEITCRVVAERIGHRGYGMLLAEIGLPPGADVDRASLEKAMKQSGWELSQYDVLPDRVIVYLWPRAGGTKFSFTFRPRYGIRAQTAPSLLYDYYNPEAHVVIAPTRFVVR